MKRIEAYVRVNKLDDVKQALDDAGIHGLSCEQVRGYGRQLGRIADAVRALTAQVAQTIDWSTCMDTVLEYAPDAVLEIGPCNALARMLAERAPELPVRAVDDFSGDTAVVDWLERMAG